MRWALERRYRSFLGRLSLTAGGRVAFTVIAAVGVVAAVADDISGGIHGDQAAGALAVFVTLALGVDIGTDWAFRTARRFVARSEPPRGPIPPRPD